LFMLLGSERLALRRPAHNGTPALEHGHAGTFAQERCLDGSCANPGGEPGRHVGSGDFPHGRPLGHTVPDLSGETPHRGSDQRETH
jgi:hypothetical protein